MLIERGRLLACAVRDNSDRAAAEYAAEKFLAELRKIQKWQRPRSQYFRSHLDYVIHLSVYLATDRKTGDVLKATSAEITEARAFLKEIGFAIPGEK